MAKKVKQSKKSKTMSVKLGGLSVNKNTASIGASVSLSKFVDPNDCHALLSCAELQCTLECDPLAGKDESEDQGTLVDEMVKVVFVARSGKIAMNAEEASFSLQFNLKDHRDQAKACVDIAGREAKLSVTKIAQLSEADADGSSQKT